MPHILHPGPGYIHPRAGRSTDHTYGLEIATDSSANYHRWITHLCHPYLGARVLEVGAGYGAVTRFLSQGIANYVATDADADCLAALRSRFERSPNVGVQKLDVLADEPDGDFDAIVMINLLEHIVDDSGVLRSLSRHLMPGGNLIIYVPALNALYGDWDDRIGHVRRYSRPQLVRVMHAAGLAVVDSRYVNLIAIPAWFAFSRLHIRAKKGAEPGGIGRELGIWDKSAVPLTRWIEGCIRPPVGLNVLGVGRSTSR